MSSYIKTGVNDYGAKPSPEPSGNVCTDASSTLKGLPSRTTGSPQIKEVIFDEAAGIPSRSGGK